MTTRNAREWVGTRAELLVYTILQAMGKVPGRDFVYQGRGGTTAFQFTDPPGLAINIMGIMQDYAEGVANSGIASLLRQQLRGLGVNLIFIDEVDLQDNPEYYVREALEYRDHSRLGDR